jgi:hypothetical protein
MPHLPIHIPSRRQALTLTACAIALLASAPTRADNETTLANASKVAQNWLQDMDGDQYGKAWDKAASVFQNQITREQWDITMIRTRGLLGSVTKRKLISANVRHQLPGMPDGDYVVLLYQSTFEHKARGSETVTPMLDKDGKWKVAGYLIR